MFSGILTKILLGLLAGSLLFGGITYAKYNWWDKPAYEKQIQDLQEAASKSKVREENKDAEISFMKDQQAIRKEKTRVKTKLHETIAEPTPDNFVDYTRRFRRVQPKGDPGVTKNGTGGSNNPNKIKSPPVIKPNG
jgi:hypothetical protein